jgi:hypothetical protein
MARTCASLARHGQGLQGRHERRDEQPQSGNALHVVQQLLPHARCDVQLDSQEGGRAGLTRLRVGWLLGRTPLSIAGPSALHLPLGRCSCAAPRVARGRVSYASGIEWCSWITCQPSWPRLNATVSLQRAAPSATSSNPYATAT